MKHYGWFMLLVFGVLMASHWFKGRTPSADALLEKPRMVLTSLSLPLEAIKQVAREPARF